MNILAIETSCDETAAAVVRDGTEVLSNVIASQVEFHRKYGGVVPEIASRKHIEAISMIIQEAMNAAKIKFSDLDAVAVTFGPGLPGALIVGICAAKAIALAIGKPLIGVNHLEGHIYANFLTPFPSPLRGEGRNKKANVQETRGEESFPFICLVVSGGHTELVLVEDHGKYKSLGRTRDDAVGEAFDKVARFLGLGYPGGPIIDDRAKNGNPEAIDFPRAMMAEEFGNDFSFSGLKTAVVYYVKRKYPELKGAHPLKDSEVNDIVASFQKAAVDILVEKTLRAMREYKVKAVALAGGVSANSLLRAEMQKRAAAAGLTVSIPPPDLCTDNAAMIGCAGYFLFQTGRVGNMNLTAVSSLRIS